MSQPIVERVAEDISFRLEHPIVELEASGRHVHLSRADADILFGPGVPLVPARELSQPGQFTCTERVGVVGPKGRFSGLVIIGPERSMSQIELSATDAVILGVDPPVRLSGALEGTPGITLVGPAGTVEVSSGVMIAKRHIHMHPSFGERYGIADRQVVSVRVWGERGVTFSNVVVRCQPDFATYMHIDRDEANACGFRPGLLGTIII